MADSKRAALKKILNGTLTRKEAKQELQQRKHFPTLIKWGEDSYHLWPDRGRMTEEQVKEELGVDTLDGIVMISFS
jgi:hypothetical protein